MQGGCIVKVVKYASLKMTKQFTGKTRIITLFVLCATSPWLAAQSSSEIVQQSLQATKHDWSAESKYDYCQRSKEDDGTKTYAVTMLFGSPYERLVAVNGHALDSGKQEKEIQKFREEASKRRAESPEERQRRISESEKSRQRDHMFMEQLPKAFDFRRAGTKDMGSYQAYVLQATPRQGYDPPNTETRALKGMEGTLWIAKQGFQWAKVQAEVEHAVSVKGFIAKVEPGTKFELEKIPVAPDVWLRRHFSMHTHAKVFFFFSHDKDEDDTYFNYEKSHDDPYLKSCDEK